MVVLEVHMERADGKKTVVYWDYGNEPLRVAMDRVGISRLAQLDMAGLSPLGVSTPLQYRGDKTF